jgi:hypothetical protein
MDPRALLDMIQRFLLPYRSLAEIESRCPHPAWRRQDGGGERAGGGSPEPIELLNSLLYDAPGVFDDLEDRLLDSEAALLEELARGEAPPAWRTYRIEQRHLVRVEKLPERGALHLCLAAPRRLAGVQEVKLLRCDPPGLADAYLPEAGLLYDVPLLFGHGAEVPELELELEVRQSPARLQELRTPELCQVGAMSAGGVAPAVEAWGRRLGRSAEARPQAAVDALLDGMEHAFEFAVTGAPRDSMLGTLLQHGIGDVHTLSQLAALVLEGWGFAARVAAGQQLFLERSSGRSRLRYAGSTGYEHRFVQWSHAASGAGGLLDLTYFRRWQFAATDRNTRAPSLPKRSVVGERARTRLRRGVYPLDLIVSGRPVPSRFVNLDSWKTYEASALVDTEIVASRMV